MSIHDWSIPWFKVEYTVNVDVAGPNNNFWGIVAIIRDFEEIILDVATWKISTLPDSYVAEAHGFRIALQFSLELGFRNIVVEWDSLNVVWAMNKYDVGYSYIDLLIDDCRKY